MSAGLDGSTARRLDGSTARRLDGSKFMVLKHIEEVALRTILIPPTP
jgi:hypothetical protein